MRHRVIAFILATTALVGLQTSAQASPTPQTEREIHSSGIELVGPALTSAPLLESLAWAFSEARVLAERNPSVFGYPWADSANGQIVLSLGTPDAQRIAEDWATRSDAARGVTPRSRLVDRTWEELEAIKNDATFLVEAGVPDAALIYMSEPDYQKNRVIVTVERLSDVLMSVLAQRYGKQAIAVRVQPDRPWVGPQIGSRPSDRSPFYGGARINAPVGGCTSGFSWSSLDTPMMVTAGHCAPTGGTVSTPAEYMGTVNSQTHENWTSGTGTVYFYGQSTYRGDLALVQMTSPRTSDPKMYLGGSTSSIAATVKEMWYRSPANGDLYCVGGATTGAICDYSVTGTGMNVQYSNGEWVRNITRGEKGGTCTDFGDSGGPAYTIRGDGGVAAKGIHSGGGSIFGHCWNYFTDIWQAFYGLPGTLKVQ